MNEYSLFYSWQSDNNHIRNVIRSAIDKAKKSLLKKEIKINIIEDSRTDNGSEHIDSGLLKSIDRADLFIADISPVYPPYKDNEDVKLLPNGNVLFETGYAVGRHGDTRCRLIAMLADGEKPKDLPFDVNHRKLLIFSDSNREPLKSLEGWIESKLPEIDKARQAKIPDESADIFIFSNGEYLKETTLNPQFKQIFFQYPSPQKQFTQNEALNTVLLGTSSKIDALIANFNNRPAIQAQIAKPITRKINLSLLPIELVMENSGSVQLRDINIHIWSDNPEVRFEETPVSESFRGPIIKRPGDLFISNDGKSLVKSINVINPTAIVSLDEVFVKLPYEAVDIRLRWAFNSSTIHSEGELLINSIPIYEPEYRESTIKGGQTEYRDIIKTE